MHNLSIERRSPRGSLSRDLAEHIKNEGPQGRIAVVSSNPIALLAATRKQWLKLARQVQCERASTLDAVKISDLTKGIAWMQSLRFSARPPDDLLEADVTFARADDFVRIPPICRTTYVTYSFEKEKLHMLTSWMPEGGAVIIYE